MLTVIYTVIAIYVLGGFITTVLLKTSLPKSEKKIPFINWVMVFFLWPIGLCYLIFFKMLGALLNGSRGY